MGRVIRPHGVRGQVVVELSSNRDERMAQGSVLQSDAGDLVVSTSSALPDRSRPGAAVTRRWLVSFEGVQTRDGAAALRGTVLRAPPMEVEGELWIHQLIGADVVDGTGTDVGTVTAVEANPASDLLVVDDERLIPLVFVTSFAEGRVRVEIPPGLLDL